MGRRVLGVVNTVIAVAASLIGSFYFFGSDGYDPVTNTLHPNWWSSVSFLVAIGAAVMLCWRHSRPVLVTGIAIVPGLIFASDALAALIALAALAANRRDRVCWLGAAGVLAASVRAAWRDLGSEASVAGSFVHPETATQRVVDAVIIALIVTAVPLLVGITRGVRGDLRRREARERELRLEMTRQEERSRIAHEMHDVLGHRLSLLSLHAGALEVSSGDDSEKAAEAARTVRTAARQSLEDLRQVIGVLRDGGGFTGKPEDDRSERPPPSVGDLPNLISGVRQAGLSADLTVLVDQSGPVPVPLGVAVYRIVQEALTNVLRHAPGCPASVTVRGGPGTGLAVEVVNPLPPAPSGPSPGSGSGLTGISERVALLGGTVTAGEAGDGVFAIRAWLPWGRQ